MIEMAAQSVGAAIEEAVKAVDGRVPSHIPLAKSNPREYWRRVRTLYRSSLAVIVGNILEWYDWTVFGYMQDILKDVFVSGSGQQAWLLFAVPFLARPFGSLVFGWIGDTCGRALSLQLAIWGMAVATALQGCLVPSLPGITWILAALRLVTGLSAGGESAGVNTYMSEFGEEGREHTLAAAIGVNNVSGSLAFFLANAVSLAVHQLPRETQLAWGWRIPFLLAAPLGVVSVLLRRGIKETSQFQRKRNEDLSCQTAAGIIPDLQDSCGESCDDSHGRSSEDSIEDSEQQKPPRPSASLRRLRTFASRAVLAALVLAAVTSCNYLPIYLVSWLEEAGLQPSVALSIAAAAKVTQVLATLPVSFAADRAGTVSVMMCGGAATGVFAVPFLWFVGETSHWPGYITAFLVLGFLLPVFISIYLVPSPLFMTSLFPMEQRGRGAGLCLGLASVVAGLMPAAASSLAKHGYLWPGALISFLILPSLLLLACAKRAAARGHLTVFQRPWLF
ncbi:proP [Symbiodinium pilosum]|uniref:ProP protein n=1 Tax=Symbiodinium pilosum TaxID=2952 RepID=A0A812X733_SYMPI|nr:proP [Symbiodinium pilosum]